MEISVLRKNLSMKTHKNAGNVEKAINQLLADKGKAEKHI